MLITRSNPRPSQRDITVYLAGGIFGLDDRDASDWREIATGMLRGYRVLNPLAMADYRGREQSLLGTIVEQDLVWIRGSSVVLANCEQPSWGTAMEIFFASRNNVQVIGFGRHGSPWLRYHACIYPTLERAVSELKAAYHVSDLGVGYGI